MLIKKITCIRFARFCHFQGQNWDQMSNFGLFKVKFGPKVTTFDPIFYPNMAKSCKYDLTSGFLDLKVHPGETFRQIRDKKFGPNLTSKIKIHDL